MANLAHVGPFDPKTEEVESWISRFKAVCLLNDMGDIIEVANDPNIDQPVGHQAEPAQGEDAAANAAALARVTVANRAALTQDRKMRTYLIAEIGTEVFGVLRRRLLPAEPVDRTIKRLLSELRRYYKAPITSNMARMTFQQRFQKDSESIDDYVMAIQHLAVPCNFGETLDEQLCGRMLYGVVSDHVRRRLLSTHNLNYDEAVRIARETEILEKQTKALGDMRRAQKPEEENNQEEKVQKLTDQNRRPFGRGRGDNYPRRGDNYPRRGDNYSRRGDNAPRRGWVQRGGGPPTQRYQTTRQDYQQNRSKTVCWRCGNQYHMANDCGAKEQQCYQCRKWGHISRCCPTTQGKVHSVEDEQQEQQRTTEDPNQEEVINMLQEQLMAQQLVQQRLELQVQQQVPKADRVQSVCESESSIEESSIFALVCCSEQAELEIVNAVGDSWFDSFDLSNLTQEIKTTVEHESDNRNETIECKLVENSDQGKDKADENNNCVDCVELKEKVIEVREVKESDVYQNVSRCENNCDDCPVWFDERTNCWKQGKKNRKIRWLANKKRKKEQVGIVEYVNVAESRPLVVDVNVEGKEISMEVDTGSKKTIMPRVTFEKLFPNKQATRCDVRLVSITNEPLLVVGQVLVKVRDKQNVSYMLSLVVCNSCKEFRPLLGREWLDKIIPNWSEGICKRFTVKDCDQEIPVLNMSNNGNDCKTDCVTELQKRYPNCFKNDRSQTIKGYTARIVMKEDAIPIICKEYTIPLSHKDQVEEQLREEIKAGIAMLVTQPEYASPMFAIPKPDGKKFRICIDFKRTVNPQLKIDYYPLPRVDEVFAKMAGGTCFTVLDLTEAYMQLEVHPDCRKFLTVNSPIGFIQYKRLPYGLASSPALFQLTMDSMLKGMKGVCCYLDDVIIVGRTRMECVLRTHEVLYVLNDHNVRVNFAKCCFFQPSVKYLGHLLDAEGKHTLPDRIKPIVECPAPTNVTELRSYLGMLNFYHQFLPDVATELRPMYELLKKGTMFKWSDECESSFIKSKELLLQNKVLVHYNPSLQIVVCTDASPYGISGVLSHRIDGVDRPVMFISCTLTETQRKYSQIQREALAIVVAIKKFHKYLAGRNFILVTDNQPLKCIFAHDKNIPVLAANRLAGWAIILSAYQYKIEYRKSEDMGPADALSRLPVKETVIEEVFVVDTLEQSPLNWEVVALETEKDVCLQKVIALSSEGWPKCVENPALLPYVKIKHALWTHEGCLMYGQRVVIPVTLRERVLKCLHEGHPGMARSKVLARSHVFWPGLDKEIEQHVKECNACSIVNYKPCSNVNVPWPDPGEHWIRVHIDLLEFKSQKFLILEDSYSRWCELWHMPYGTTASQVIDKLMLAFAVFGPPEVIVSDNGPPFNSAEFTNFCTDKLIVLKRVPFYRPKSNGRAERRVQIAKRTFEKFLLSKEAEAFPTIHHKIVHFLITNRNTPSMATGVPPAHLALVKAPRTAVTVLKPPLQRKYVHIPDRAVFQEQDKVDIRLKPDAEIKPGVVVRQLGPTIYLVQIGNVVMPVQINQMRLAPTMLTSNLEPTRQPNLPKPSYIVPLLPERIPYQPPPKPTPNLSTLRNPNNPLSPIVERHQPIQVPSPVPTLPPPVSPTMPILSPQIRNANHIPSQHSTPVLPMVRCSSRISKGQAPRKLDL